MRNIRRPVPTFSDRLAALDGERGSKTKGTRSAGPELLPHSAVVTRHAVAARGAPHSPGNSGDDFLTVSEVAVILRFVERQVRKLITEGVIHSFVFETAIRIRRSDLDEYINRCSRPRPPKSRG